MVGIFALNESPLSTLTWLSSSSFVCPWICQRIIRRSPNTLAFNGDDLFFCRIATSRCDFVSGTKAPHRQSYGASMSTCSLVYAIPSHVHRLSFLCARIVVRGGYSPCCSPKDRMNRIFSMEHQQGVAQQQNLIMIHSSRLYKFYKLGTTKRSCTPIYHTLLPEKALINLGKTFLQEPLLPFRPQSR